MVLFFLLLCNLIAFDLLLLPNTIALGRLVRVLLQRKPDRLNDKLNKSVEDKVTVRAIPPSSLVPPPGRHHQTCDFLLHCEEEQADEGCLSHSLRARKLCGKGDCSRLSTGDSSG